MNQAPPSKGKANRKPKIALRSPFPEGEGGQGVRSRIAALLVVLGIGAAAALAGCAALNPPPTPQQQAARIEPMLSAAGFLMLPADTAEKQQTLDRLLPLQVQYYVGKTGNLRYWMADPYYCRCMFTGSERAYQLYEQMRLNQRLAKKEEAASVAELEARQEEEMNLQMEEFNPYGAGFAGPDYVW
ncbi:MAG: hypothetical protein ACREQI_11045 [Candidatus Binataceae bacterium]